MCKFSAFSVTVTDLTNSSQRTNETWRYFTYSLVHKNWEHLLVNLAMFVPLTFSLHSQLKSQFAGFGWVFLLYRVGVSGGSETHVKLATGSFWLPGLLHL